MIALEVVQNTEKKRFETHIDGHTAFVDYIIAKGDRIFLTHTEVPKALGGKGVGSGLIKKVLLMVEEMELKLAPLCPFVAAYIKKHPEWSRILADGYSVE